MKSDVAPLGLLRGDRLEPWSGCQDILEFDRLTKFPATVLFWRKSLEGVAHHRNPIFAAFTGILPGSTIALDWMHTLSLGVFQTWAALVVHSLIEVDAWATGCTEFSARLAASTYRLASDFQRFVRTANSTTGRNLTEATHLKPESFGTKATPKCGLKAGETNAFLEYMAMEFLPTRAALLGGEGKLLSQAGKHLFSILQLIRKHPKTAPASMIQGFYLNAKNYLRIMGELGIKAKPKDHMMIELASRLPWLGSPQLYGCWHDEALNKLLKSVAGGAHPMVHERRILVQFPIAHDNERAGRTITKRRRLG